MVKRLRIIIMMLLLLALLVTGCGIPKTEHDAVLAERDAAQTKVISLQTDLTAAQNELTSTKAELTSTKAELTSTKAELTSTKAELASTKVELASTQNELISFKSALASRNIQVDQVQKLLVMPSIPIPISPISGWVSDAYPRTTALQWKSSQGAQPITYYCQVEFSWAGDFTRFGSWSTGEYGEHFPALVSVNDTKYTFDFVGAQPGRWRVKAKNSTGESDWSEWQYF